MHILGLTDTSQHHDNSAALIRDGKVILAVSEERFTRIKHDRSFPINAIKACCDAAEISLQDIDYFIVAWPRTYYYRYFIKHHLAELLKLFIPLSINRPLALAGYLNESVKEQSILVRNLKDGLRKINITKNKIIFIDHQRAHAASAYRTSGFSECLALSMDGYGPNDNREPTAGAAFICKDGEMRKVEEIPFPASMGIFYSGITSAIGFRAFDEEGKTMALAAYGNSQKCIDELRVLAPRFERGKWIVSKYWIHYLPYLNKKIFSNTIVYKKIKKLIHRISREDVAAATQNILEEEIIKYITFLHKKYEFEKIALAGGIFLNVKLNKLIMELPFIKEIHIHSNPGDGGTALGAALEFSFQKKGFSKNNNFVFEDLGMEFSDFEIERALVAFDGQIVYKYIEDIATYTGRELSKGKIIGWFQGREEWGPRALGRRSVLADPRLKDVNNRINKRLKRREYFMPFGPSCISEKSEAWFRNLRFSPFMTLIFDVPSEKQSNIKGVVHIDGTSRIQTVNKDSNPLYYSVIDVFYKEIGIPIILNTSFNRHGLPIVHTPEDAIEHLLEGCIDELAIGSFVVKKMA